LSKAVRALPIWMRPVGEGAKRTIGAEVMSLHRSVAARQQYWWRRRAKRVQ
jgi:hypothetical protein